MYLVLLNVVCFLSLGVCLCSVCGGCAFCLMCDACSLRCSWSRSIFVSLYRFCVVVSCVYPVAVLNATFCALLYL